MEGRRGGWKPALEPGMQVLQMIFATVAFAAGAKYASHPQFAYLIFVGVTTIVIGVVFIALHMKHHQAPRAALIVDLLWSFLWLLAAILVSVTVHSIKDRGAGIYFSISFSWLTLAWFLRSLYLDSKELQAERKTASGDVGHPPAAAATAGTRAGGTLYMPRPGASSAGTVHAAAPGAPAANVVYVTGSGIPMAGMVHAPAPGNMTGSMVYSPGPGAPPGGLVSSPGPSFSGKRVMYAPEQCASPQGLMHAADASAGGVVNAVGPCLPVGGVAYNTEAAAPVGGMVLAPRSGGPGGEVL